MNFKKVYIIENFLKILWYIFEAIQPTQLLSFV